MNVLDFQRKKIAKEKIVMVTAYDASMGRLLAAADVDCLLVGDSLAMLVHGFDSTLHATIEMMATHTRAVVRGTAGKKFVVGDMPFLSTRKGHQHAMDCVDALMKAGANAIKIEGVRGQEEMIRHIVESGIPVMGHLGLTPQSVNAFGGFKVQAKQKSEQELLKKDALKLQELGAFACVLECIPADLAEEVSQMLLIPTIGIGAGPSTDGQVLVYHDLLGLNGDFRPKFLKTYLEGEKIQRQAFNEFTREVRMGLFPTEKESYHA
jgi:3-methyl-2-oxobutanoate hydroxymethyltransferase